MCNKRTRTLMVILSVALSAPAVLAKSEAKKWVGTWASSPLLDAHAKNAEELLAGGTQSGVARLWNLNTGSIMTTYAAPSAGSRK